MILLKHPDFDKNINTDGNENNSFEIGSYWFNKVLWIKISIIILQDYHFFKN